MPGPRIPPRFLNGLSGEQKKEAQSLYYLMKDERRIASNMLSISFLAGGGVCLTLVFGLSKLYILGDLVDRFRSVGHPIAGAAIIGLVVFALVYLLCWTLLATYIHDIRARIRQRLEGWDARFVMYKILKNDRRPFYTSLAAVLLRDIPEPETRTTSVRAYY
jgi:hypothetical protein